MGIFCNISQLIKIIKNLNIFQPPFIIVFILIFNLAFCNTDLNVEDENDGLAIVPDKISMFLLEICYYDRVMQEIFFRIIHRSLFTVLVYFYKDQLTL